MSNESEQQGGKELSEIERAKLTREVNEDYLLQEMVALAEQGIEFAVTLNVSGAIVSGKLVGGKKYYEALNDLFRQGGGDDVATILAERFAPYVAIYDTPPFDRPAPAYIHLTDARGWSPRGDSTPPVLWRGKIASVSGFSLGYLEAK